MGLLSKIKKPNVPTIGLIVSFFLFCICLSFGFSSANYDKSATFISYVYDNCAESRNKDFSYAGHFHNDSTTLIANANRINRTFYNNRNTLAIVENNGMTLNGKEIHFSNSSQLDDQKNYTTNHLIFAREEGKYVCDLDFYTTPDTKITDKDNKVVPCFISLSTAKTLLVNSGDTLTSLLYKEMPFVEQKPRKIRYFLAGVWDDTYIARSYYNFNSFYVDLGKEIVFINDAIYPLGSGLYNLDYYILFSNLLEKNKEFLHYCRNLSSTYFNYDVPNLKINSYRTTNNKTLSDAFASLPTPNTVVVLKFISIFGFICAPIAFVAFLLFFVYWRFDIKSSKILYYLRYIVIPVTFLFSVLLLYLFTKINVAGVPFFAFSRIALQILSVLSLVFSGLSFFIMFKPKEKRIASTVNSPKSGNFCAFISMGNLDERTATTVRIANYIDILKANNFGYAHIGFFDSSKSSEINIGINRYSKFLNFLLAPVLFLYELKRLREKTKFNILVIYSPLPVLTTLLVLFYAHQEDIKVIHDVTEFQSPSQFNIKSLGLFYSWNVISNKLLIRPNDSVIAITTYLDNYFQRKGCETIIIPPIFNPDVIPYIKKEKQDKIVFAYLGSPGKKDDLNCCFKGFISFLEKNPTYVDKIQIDLYGPNESDYKDLLSECDEKIKPCFIFNKRVSNNELSEVYKKASFTFLMRDREKRFAKAGFPSKVVESLFFDTPVITNETSDLKEKINDNQVIIFVSGYSSDEFASAVERCVHNYVYKPKYCRNIAVERFSTNEYAEAFVEFVSHNKELNSECAEEVKKNKIDI